MARGVNTNVFHPMMELYQSSYTVVLSDWPGLGRSSLSKTGRPLSVLDYLEVLKGVIYHLKIASAVLIGHSFGGIVSMHMAVEYPERVDGLAVIGPGRIRRIESPSKIITLQLAKEAREFGCWPHVDDRVSFNMPASSPALARALLRAVTMTTNPEGYAQICEALCADSHADPDYSRISCPTVVIGGRWMRLRLWRQQRS